MPRSKRGRSKKSAGQNAAPVVSRGNASSETSKPGGNTSSKVSSNNRPSAHGVIKVLPTMGVAPAKVAEKYCHPSETINLATTIEGTRNAVRKAVDGVLTDHAVKCATPLEKMNSIIKMLLRKLEDRGVSDIQGINPGLEDTIEDLFDEICEEDRDIDEEIFREDLIKYILIGSGHLEKLSIGTMFEILLDLDDYGSMDNNEPGCPSRVSSSVNKFFGLTKHEFARQSEEVQLTRKRTYIREGIRYCKDMEEFLVEKHKKLIAMGNGDPDSPFEECSEGNEKIKKIDMEYRRYKEMEKGLKNENARLPGNEEAGTCPYRDGFRLIFLNGEIGVRTKEEESTIDNNFSNTPFPVVKQLVDNWRRESGEVVEEVMAEDASSKETTSVVYEHSLIPIAGIQLFHELI